VAVALALVLAGAIVFVVSRSDLGTQVPQVRLLKATVAPGRVSLSWQAPAGATIDHYLVARNGEEIATVASRYLGHVDANVAPGTRYRYEVTAVTADGDTSAPAAVTIRTPMPDVATAAPSGSYRVRMTVTAAQGWESIGPGDRRTLTWRFTANGERLAGASLGGTWHLALTRTSLPWFRGTTRAQLSACSFTPVTDTITVRLRPTAGRMIGGRWVASRFTGTYRDVSPSATAGLSTCPGSSYSARLEGVRA
jgi:fibronectin type III domain protein